MSRGKRYDKEPRLNVKKILAVIIAIVVIIMFIIVIKKLLTDNKEPIKVESYFTVYTDGKWGVINSSGNIVIEPTYDEMILIPNNKQDVFICMYDVDYNNNTYKTKVLNSKGKEIIQDYDTVEAIENYDENNNIWYEDNVLKVSKNGLYGLINFSGKTLLDCKYETIQALIGIKNSLLITKDSKTGLCDNTGNVIINPEYKEIKALGKEYKNGYIVVSTDNKYGVIDFTKKAILEAKYEDIKSVYGNDMFVVKENGAYKVINKSGNTIIENKFDNVKSIDEKNIIIEKNGKYGVINIEDEEKIPTKYDDLTYAYSNYYIAKQGTKYGIITTENEIVVPIEYTSIVYRQVAQFIEAELDGQSDTIILDTNFEVKLTGIIAEVNETKGYIRIRIDDGYKYYNFKFEETASSAILTSNTIFLSKKDDKYGYVDKDGNVVVDYIYDDATEQNVYGYAAVKKDGKWGSINKDGSIVIDTIYTLENNLVIEFIDKWHLGIDLNAYYFTN